MIFVRLVYAVLGLTAVALAIVVGVRSGGVAWVLVVVFAVAPDLTMLIRDGTPTVQGQLSPPAVPFYNGVHRLWGPLALLPVAAIVAVAVNQQAWLAAPLAWLAHVSLDRSLGFGLRTADGFQRP